MHKFKGTHKKIKPFFPSPNLHWLLFSVAVSQEKSAESRVTGGAESSGAEGREQRPDLFPLLVLGPQPMPMNFTDSLDSATEVNHVVICLREVFET